MQKSWYLDPKTWLSILFLLLLSSALIYFFKHRSSLKGIQADLADSTPRITMQDFEFIKYRGSESNVFVRAKSAAFFEPNRIEISGGLSGERIFENGDIETVKAQKGRAEFEASRLEQMMSNAKLVRSVVQEDVHIKVREHNIQTDYVEYFAAIGTLFSKNPVTVRGEGRWMQSSNGFNYELDKEILSMEGNVEGVVENADTQIK